MGEEVDERRVGRKKGMKWRCRLRDRQLFDVTELKIWEEEKEG